MFQFFQNNGVLIFVGVIALLMSAIACSAPAPTATPVPTLTPTPEPSTGNWEQFVNTDPITDKKDTVITLRASQSDLEFPYEDPVIFVQCRNLSQGGPILWVTIFWDAYIDSYFKLEWRVDSETVSEDLRPSEQPWRLLGDSTTVSSKPEQIVSDLSRADKITARVSSTAGVYTAIWHPEGFAEAYKPVEEACKQ